MPKRKLKIDLTKNIKKLEITTKKVVGTHLIGTYKSAFKGRGLEFASFREYSQNDDASQIDWKASVRTNKLLIKEFEEERKIDIFFLIDVSNSMIFGSTDKLKNEYATELAASFVFTIIEAGDEVGYALFNDEIVKISHPSSGKHQFFNLAKDLTNPENYGGDYDIEKALKYLLSFLPQGTLLIIISDFIGLKENWTHYLKTTARKFDVIAIKIEDPRDIKLPAESYNIMLTDPYSNKTIVVDPLYAKLQYEEYAKNQKRNLEQSFRELRIDLLSIQTDKPFVQPLINFFVRRKRKWR
jgi:uncharacterized protein (DUF58 family)|tara:strand:+ start:2756 stop:3649 length:894 start_codon:yes stop_codon:yes gene_type:complete